MRTCCDQDRPRMEYLYKLPFTVLEVCEGLFWYQIEIGSLLVELSIFKEQTNCQ